MTKIDSRRSSPKPATGPSADSTTGAQGTRGPAPATLDALAKDGGRGERDVVVKGGRARGAPPSGGTGPSGPLPPPPLEADLAEVATSRAAGVSGLGFEATQLAPLADAEVPGAGPCFEEAGQCLERASDRMSEGDASEGMSLLREGGEHLEEGTSRLESKAPDAEITARARTLTKEVKEDERGFFEAVRETAIRHYAAPAVRKLDQPGDQVRLEGSLEGNLRLAKAGGSAAVAVEVEDAPSGTAPTYKVAMEGALSVQAGGDVRALGVGAEAMGGVGGKIGIEASGLNAEQAASFLASAATAASGGAGTMWELSSGRAAEHLDHITAVTLSGTVAGEVTAGAGISDAATAGGEASVRLITDKGRVTHIELESKVSASATQKEGAMGAEAVVAQTTIEATGRTRYALAEPVSLVDVLGSPLQSIGKVRGEPTASVEVKATAKGPLLGAEFVGTAHSGLAVDLDQVVGAAMKGESTGLKLEGTLTRFRRVEGSFVGDVGAGEGGIALEARSGAGRDRVSGELGDVIRSLAPPDSAEVPRLVGSR